MSIISTRSHYGLQLLIALAQKGTGGVLDLASFSRAKGISNGYLSKLAIELRRAGLLKSLRGIGGGYSLGKPAASISILKVVEILEGDNFALDPGKKAFTVGQGDEVTPLWKGLDRHIRTYLQKINLATLAGLSSSDFII